MTYIVEARWAGDLMASREAVTFDAACGFLDELEAFWGFGKHMHYRLYNDDRADYCTIDGWDDGLTKDEREAVEARGSV